MPDEANKVSKEEIAIQAIDALIKRKRPILEDLLAKVDRERAELASLEDTKKLLVVSSIEGVLSCKSEEDAGNSGTDSERGTPEDWLRPIFKLLGTKKAIESALEDFSRPVEIEELVKELYDTHSDAEFKRARNSLSAALRRGAEENLWKKVGRSFYEANSVRSSDQDEDDNVNETEHLGHHATRPQFSLAQALEELELNPPTQSQL